jgi:hypothetical protein
MTVPGATVRALPGDVDATRRWLRREAAAARELAGRTSHGRRARSTGIFVPFIPNGPVVTPDYPASTLSVASAGAGEAVPRSSSAA